MRGRAGSLWGQKEEAACGEAGQRDGEGKGWVSSGLPRTIYRDMTSSLGHRWTRGTLVAGRAVWRLW